MTTINFSALLAGPSGAEFSCPQGRRQRKEPELRPSFGGWDNAQPCSPRDGLSHAEFWRLCGASRGALTLDISQPMVPKPRIGSKRAQGQVLQPLLEFDVVRAHCERSILCQKR